MLLQSPVALLFSLVLGMSTSAAPVVFKSHLAPREVWAPPITSPQSDTIWTIGSEATVTWYVEKARSSVWGGSSLLTASPSDLFVGDRDTANPPSQVTNSQGTLLLGFLNSDGSGGENLMTGQLTDVKHVSYIHFSSIIL